MNSVNLIGIVASTPELRKTTSGVSCCSFSVAVDRDYQTEAGKPISDYINIATWRKVAETSASFVKGQQVAVSGSLQTRSYTGKDGQRVRVVEVVADHVEALGNHAPVASAAAAPSRQQYAPPQPEPVETDELPF